MTKLGFINYFFLQWFCFRLARCQSPIKLSIDFGAGFLKEGEYETGSKMQWYSVLYFVVPLTGWNNDYRFMGKQRLRRITRKRMISTSTL